MSRSSSSLGNCSARPGACGRRLEQPRILLLHVAQMRDQHLGESRGVLEAKEVREAVEPSSSAGRVWVCSSATICRRCSARRRNR